VLCTPSNLPCVRAWCTHVSALTLSAFGVFTGFVYGLPLLLPNVIPLYIDVGWHICKGRDIGQTIASEVGY
jgi:hypothetical protein